MERVEPPGRNAPVDGAATQAKREHLPPGNHPVLPGSEVRERSVRGCSQFASVFGVNCEHPPTDGEGVARDARFAKEGCAWLRYQPKLRSMMRWLDIARSRMVRSLGGSAGMRRWSCSARRNADPWRAENAA